MRVYFRPLAVRDIDRDADYIADDSLREAERYIAAVRATTELLAALPKAGTEVFSRRKRLKGLRRIIVDGFPNHVIYYLPKRHTIEVVRVIHGARDRGRLLDLDE